MEPTEDLMGGSSDEEPFQESQPDISHVYLLSQSQKIDLCVSHPPLPSLPPTHLSCISLVSPVPLLVFSSAYLLPACSCNSPLPHSLISSVFILALVFSSVFVVALVPFCRVPSCWPALLSLVSVFYELNHDSSVPVSAVSCFWVHLLRYT